MSERLKSQLEQSRQELLDMGLRGNSLLSLGKTSKVIDVINEKTTLVFEYLVEDSESLSFIPSDEKSISLLKNAGDEDNPLAVFSEDLSENAEIEPENKKKSKKKITLQSDLLKPELDKRLLKIKTDADTLIQEQGIDLLYLATGFLKWYEDDNSEIIRYAPLVLIPVKIVRTTNKSSYKIEYTQAEMGTNLTLRSKLKMEFSIELPDFSETDDGYLLDDYFNKVSETVSHKKRWAVEQDKIALSFFSFGKFQMYQDLDSEIWPEDKKPFNNPIIKKIFADGFEEDTHLLNSMPMDLNKTEEITLILDADSSQSEAVLAAKSGANLVIQGPPGTGKSQTITNIISQALADNKKILFVAEKMAALEVVKRRLDNCNIGNAVLELHSYKANKVSVLNSLKTTLEQEQQYAPEHNQEINKLISLRDKLNNYSNSVNTIIGNTGYSYIQAIGLKVRYENELKKSEIALEKLPNTDFDFSGYSNSQYKDNLDKMTALSDYLNDHNHLNNNIFALTQLQLAEFSPDIIQRSLVDIDAIKRTQDAIYKGLYEPAVYFKYEHLMVDATHGEIIFNFLKLLKNKSTISHFKINNDVWTKHGDLIVNLIRQGIVLQEKRNQLSTLYTEAAFSYDFDNERSVFTKNNEKWYRFLSMEFFKAKNSFKQYCKNELQGSVAEWIQQIDELMVFKNEEKSFIDSARVFSDILGNHWVSQNFQWKTLEKSANWLNLFFKQATKSESIAEFFQHYILNESTFNLTDEWIARMESNIAERKKHLQQLATLIKSDQTFIQTVDTLPQDKLYVLRHDIDKLFNVIKRNSLLQELKNAGLNAWAETISHWNYPAHLLKECFEYSFFNGLANYYYRVSADIQSFERSEHEKNIKAFSGIDKNLFSFSREKLVNQLYKNLPEREKNPEITLLNREFAKKRRQMPIRRLIKEVGKTIQQIKPVFMMSPMSIATYLEPNAVEFDLVIFDEASQVKVSDALGAILRGKQVIVVGDTKQMPPTNFFEKQYILEDEEAENSQTSDIESILNLFITSNTPQRMLKWHYRSKHESLIVVSNQEFYDNKLMIFPSSGVNSNANGLTFHYLENAVYDRGGARNNLEEAKAVALEVIRHARETPHLTLGVVAFSQAQQETILLEVERLRKNIPELSEFFGHRDDGENFFIKNLENVQGDERDTIMISIGYGKNSNGTLSTNFGPINKVGGERRLNVLISRAKMNMKVFSNFKAIDIPITETSPFGLKALKNFLLYAETKHLNKNEETQRLPDSPFEEEVIKAIIAMGYQVQPQVGCAGFYIDIAVRDPNKLGRYILAVECDGATYHSSRTARDRDRIRQNVLEQLEWRFHRIWSTDWFRNQSSEIERLRQSIKASIEYYSEADNKIQAEKYAVLNH